MLAIVPKKLLRNKSRDVHQTGEDDNRGSQFKLLKELECVGGVAINGQKSCSGPRPQLSSSLQSNPTALALRRECNEGNSHPQNLSAIFCIESSLDRWVAEAPMMATLPYSQTGLAKDL